jgi:LuxR family transcriptional regulator, maltose regulon positive regulatory protein
MSKPFASWLLSSKVSPPRISINANRRDELLVLLSEHLDKRVVLLEAPAGFGKTLLLSQWREVLRYEENTVAWISINQTDQPDILLPYIAFAFHQAGLDMTATGLLSATHTQGDSSYLLGNLLKVIEESKRKCVLVFDDFENISDDSLSEIIESLLNLQSQNLQLVFACRQNPGLSLSSLMVEGNVLSIGPQQLMFDKNEIDHFFQNSLGNTEIENIIERTGGWPVALQLIRSFGTGSSSTPGSVDITASNKLISEYFREQLFNNLSEDEQSFLLQTSMLDVITADCANSIRGKEDALEIMHGLDYLEGIFSPLEDEQEAWRVHPLVREHLEQELKESSLSEYESLCRKVATWMISNERGLEAIRYALAANDSDYAAEILEEMGGIMLWIREGMSRLTTGLELLQSFELSEYPRIQLGRCLLHMKTGDMNKARLTFDKVRQVSDNFNSDRPGGDDTLLRIESYSIEIMMAEYGCTPDNPILPDTAFTFLLENTSEEPTIHGYIKTLQCLTSLQIGDFDNCMRHGEEAINEYLSGNSLYGELFIYFYFGMAELARARTALALKQYTRATQTIHSDFPGDTGLKILGNAIIGEYYWETGQTTSTKKHIRHVINNISEMESYFDIYMAAYQTSISYLLYDKGLKEALGFIDNAMEHAKNQSLDRLEDFLLSNQLSILYLSNSDEDALELFRNNSLTFNPGDALLKKTWREIEALSVAMCRAARMQNDAERMNVSLTALCKLATETNNIRLLINLQIQIALNHVMLNNEASAVTYLSEAIQLASEGQYLRPFMNEHSFLTPLFDATFEHMQTEKCSAASLQTLEELMHSQSAQKTIPGEAEGFSAREIQILSELSHGQPDKLIARQTGLSAHGVRYHLKNIYSKMGVENRLQAITRAQEMGLL